MTTIGPDGLGERSVDRGRRMLVAGVAAAAATACSPTVRVEPPERPIEINLNVRITQEVRVRIDRELEQVFEENDDIF